MYLAVGTVTRFSRPISSRTVIILRVPLRTTVQLENIQLNNGRGEWISTIILSRELVYS